MKSGLLNGIRILYGRSRPALETRHRFAVGLEVGLLPGHSFRGVVSGRFRVIELLTRKDGRALYRIRSPEELFERIAGEHELHELSVRT